MYIQMTPWTVAILIECIVLALACAVFFFLRTEQARGEMKVRLDEAAQAIEDAKAEVQRVQEEAMRKRTIVTFDDDDLQAMRDAGELAGDEEQLNGLKTRVGEASEVITTMTGAASELNAKLSEVMEKQMEAVNMVGRLGGTGGLPPELKEKAEAILDVFRSMDDLLGVAYEEVDKVETGLGEVSAVVSDFKEADPKVKTPTAAMLNRTLKRKAGVEVEEEPESSVEPEPPMDAFDAEGSEQQEAVV